MIRWDLLESLTQYSSHYQSELIAEGVKGVCQREGWGVEEKKLLEMWKEKQKEGKEIVREETDEGSAQMGEREEWRWRGGKGVDSQIRTGCAAGLWLPSISPSSVFNTFFVIYEAETQRRCRVRLASLWVFNTGKITEKVQGKWIVLVWETGRCMTCANS